MDEDTRNYEVKDHVEVVPVTEVSEEGVRRYSLDDYMEMESRLSNAKPVQKKNEVADRELAIEKKVVNQSAPPAENKEIDPFNSSIEDSLKLRAEERRKGSRNSITSSITVLPRSMRSRSSLHIREWECNCMKEHPKTVHPGFR